MKKCNLSTVMKKAVPIAVCMVLIGLVFCACGGSDEEIAVKGVTISMPEGKSPSIVAGETLQLTAKFNPANATNKKVSWESSRVDFVTVDSKGLVTGIAAGYATITVSTVNGKYEDTLIVTVTAANVPVTGIALNTKTKTDLEVGSTFNLTAAFTPANATNRGVTWSNSDSTIATIADTGTTMRTITGVKIGKTTITVKADEGNFTDSCEVTVVAATVSSVTLNSTTRTLVFLAQPAPTYQLIATVAPVAVEDKTVTWVSSDPLVATVANGLVTAVAKGETTITATSVAPPQKTATCTIIVVTEPLVSPIIDEFDYYTSSLFAQTGGAMPALAAELGFTFEFMDWGGLAVSDVPNNSGPIEGSEPKGGAWAGNDENTSIQRIYTVPNNFASLLAKYPNVAFNLYTRAGTNGGGAEANAAYMTSDDNPPRPMSFELHTGTHPDHTVYRASVPGPERRTLSPGCGRYDSGWVDIVVPLADFKDDKGVSLTAGTDLIITGWRFTTNQELMHVFISKVELQEEK